MSSSRNIVSFTVFFLCVVSQLASLAIAQQTKPQSLKQKQFSLGKTISAASKTQHFQSPDAAELRAVELLFQATLTESKSRAKNAVEADQLSARAVAFLRLQADWNELEMQLQQVSINDHEIWILRESSNAQRGRGLYAFNPGVTTPLAIQAPHSFFDKHTRAINVRLFESGLISTAAWNTVRRSAADLAHRRYHYLNAFTTAFANTHIRGSVVQLHGFSREKRKTAAGRDADLIISNGTEYPNAAAQRLSVSMKASLQGKAVMLYPTDCSELGAVTNTQGTLIRSMGSNAFLHLEMSQSLRESLRRDGDIRAVFLQSLLSICRR